ncbi:protein phosphatase 2C domain-containing protein [Micromonospora palomenae]|uniref:protein phosphatase 2C domain-containing protein n=1 Tax=Micromonospora palomenae TaxID=1461247 RepID=UPI00147906E6|nr:protein phosphatase 2C domain-containing protein [Micromonospora palomenae]
MIDGADIGSITYRAASVRGLSHQERGEPRQDAYVVRFTRDLHWLVGCIADGVSSAKRSHEAAAAICDRITDILVDHLIENPPSDPSEWAQEARAIPWDWAVGAANGAVADLARPYLAKASKRRGEPDDLVTQKAPVPHAHARTIMSATALAFAVATEPSSDGTYRAMLANVAGDSAAFLLERDLWMPLTQIKNEGEHIFSSTVKSLPDDAQVVPKPLHLRPGQSLIMMTDGLGDPLGGATGSVSRFLGVNWRTPPDLLAFAQHLAFYRKTFTDDRTAVAIWPGPARRTR